MTSLKRTIAALLLMLLLAAQLPAPAFAEKPSGKTNRFNIVLLVDKSGSLCCENGKGTDPDGLRYDALRQFLGLLTESGNNVGVIVFDEFIRYESAVEPLAGMEAKKELVHTVEKYFPCYDTDIGGAMLRATGLLEKMQQKNNLPCMILLFSDGMTDFTTGNIAARRHSSYEKAQQALDRARELGITINGILLNVDGIAERGRQEFLLYTDRQYGSAGVFEEVQRPEDLGKAFQVFYTVINNTAYTGAQRVSFTEQGEAEIFFTVPSFGVEEVNVIVEGEHLRAADSKNDVEMEILRPDGEAFSAEGHEIKCARYQLVKIPAPQLGRWQVRLRGEPGDWVDVTMVCNASLSVTLDADSPEEGYTVRTPYRFRAWVKDPGVERLTEEQLAALDVRLVLEELATGELRELPMTLTDEEDTGGRAYACEYRFPRSGVYRISAAAGLEGFRLRSAETLESGVMSQPLTAEVDAITDMLAWGQFRDGVWELELDALFGSDRESGLHYTVSDDHDGSVRADNGVLRVEPRSAKPVAFTLTATDPMEQSAAISFELTAPAVTAAYKKITGVKEMGSFRDGVWEAALDELFDDPKDAALAYALSTECGGAVTVKDGMLRARLSENTQPLSFALTATDSTEQSAKISFELSIPVLTAKVEQVTNMMRLGQLRDYQWELPVSGLFYDPDNSPLSYALSDDLDGAVTLEDGVLRVDFHTLREAAFSLSASNPYGREAVIPFTLRVPGPAAAVSEIAETVKTGLFQEHVWERKVEGLFSDPKGTALSYTLSEDAPSAAKLEDGVLTVDMQGVKKAAFSVKATDEYGLSTELPVTLTEKNMTLFYLLWALLVLLLICAAAGVGYYLYKRSRED